MERYNPFASSEPETDRFGSPDIEPPSYAASRSQQDPSSADRTALGLPPSGPARAPSLSSSAVTNSGRYTTSFPDPFEPPIDGQEPAVDRPTEDEQEVGQPAVSSQSPRSNSVTFAPRGVSTRAADQSTGRANRQQSVTGSGPLSSFLSRATSVTTGSMTERVNEAMRSAVDSLQSVPSNLNSRISSATNQIVGGASSTGSLGPTAGTMSFANNHSQTTAVINRLKVILVIDDQSAGHDWAALFSGQAPGSVTTNSAQAAFTSLLTSAAAQLANSPMSLGGGSASSASNQMGSLLVEQADMQDISLLANQSTGTATILVNSMVPASSPCHQPLSRTGSSGKSTNLSPVNQGPRVVRPEYVVVRQRMMGGQPGEHLRSIVTALDYCMVPMLEPYQVWSVFQDRQAIFSRLLRVQRALGKENFPLIPQVYCQTKRDLLNYVNSRTIPLPCLLRTGHLGEGKMRADDLQILKGIVNFVATNHLNCTVEPYLEVKNDLLVQKIGKNLKMFRRTVQPDRKLKGAQTSFTSQQEDYPAARQSAARQTSLSNLGASLSSLIPGSSTNSQLYSQTDKQQSLDQYERLTEVGSRYKSWMQAIAREFDDQLEAFSLKIVVTREDREYIVGLEDCSMGFVGPIESQDEDRRHFVELISGHLNDDNNQAAGVAGQPMSDSMDWISREQGTGKQATSDFRRCSSDDKAIHSMADTTSLASARQPLDESPSAGLGAQGKHQSRLDKTKAHGQFETQKNLSSGNQQGTKRLNCASSGNICHNGVAGYPCGPAGGSGNSRPFGQLSSRSQSVSVNQSDYLEDQMVMHKSSFFTRRQSERSDSMTNDESVSQTDGLFSSPGSQQLIGGSASGDQFLSGHKRQSSFGRTFLDQTSTAISSLQSKSIGLLRKFDSRTAQELMSSTPPMSAKSDRNFRPFGANELVHKSSLEPSVSNSSDDPVSEAALSRLTTTSTTCGGQSTSRARNSIKAQSVDGSMVAACGANSPGAASSRSLRRRETPPKPPPPIMPANHALGARQSSLASQSIGPGTRSSTMSTPTTTPTRSRPPKEVADADATSGSRPPMTRQSSALSTFESYDPGLSSSVPRHDQSSSMEPNNSKGNASVDVPKRHNNFDSVSIASGDSTATTSENTAAEDTMNNLKKTFASIFGDRGGDQ